jgi:hypothetical protein
VKLLLHKYHNTFLLIATMSTFKIQPVYCELLMGWLACAEKSVATINWEEALSTVLWRFKGGLLGSYPMMFPSECSSTYFPDGHTTAILARGPEDADWRALRRIVRTQMMEKKRTRHAQAAWVHSYSITRLAIEDTVGKLPAITGLHAVYYLLRTLWASMGPAKSEDGSMFRFLREMVILTASASFLDLKSAEDAAARLQWSLREIPLAKIRSLAATMDKIMRFAMSRLAARTARSRGSAMDDGSWRQLRLEDMSARSYTLEGYRVRVTSGCAVMTIRDQVLALSTSDLQRVRAFLIGAASGLFATVAQVCVAPGPERQMGAKIATAYMDQVSRLLRSSAKVPLGDEVKICKGYKRAFGAYLGELSGPLCADETHELWKEADETCRQLEVRQWVDLIRPWTAQTSFNLGKVYKLCPPPDASPGGTMLERHEMIGNHNSISPDAALVFESELRAQILRSYIRTPGVKLELRGKKPVWFDHYLHRQFDRVPSDEIHEYLAWENTGEMPQRSPEDPAVWKDSGLGYDTLEEGMDPDRAKMKGNMLVRMVFDPALPMPGQNHVGHLHDHKVDIKPEGYKDPARAIYSGNLRDRLNQSWMEAAVESVAVNHPSYMIAASAEQREERTRMIVERPDSWENVAMYYSFDIAGWSPRMPPEVQRISHDIWGRLFGCDMFHQAHQINEGSRVYMNKGGYQAWYRNNGVNFEGYNGKEMTMILITLMSLSVKVWRQDLPRARLCTAVEAEKQSAGLLAYIDDGLAKLVLPVKKAVPMFKLYKATCVRVFSTMGFTIEPSKCYPSDRFAIFLNEAYLLGRHVSHGTRAAMTMSTESIEEHTSLIERCEAVAGGSTGAVMAGLDVLTGYMLMCYAVHGHLTEWIPRIDPVLAALWSTMPRAWGGLGLPSLLALGTSGAGAALEEGVRTMQCAAKVSLLARKVFLAKVRGGLTDRSAHAILSSPLGGSSSTGVMTVSRVGPVVRKGLVNLKMKGVLSPLAQTFLRYGSEESFQDYASALIPHSGPAVLQEQLLVDLKDVHPHTVFMTFCTRLEKSSTLFRIVGGKEVSRMIRANKEDARGSYRILKSVALL